MAKKPQNTTDEVASPLHVLMTKRRRDRYERAADRSDVSISEWVRRVLDAECDRFEQANKENEQ